MPLKQAAEPKKFPIRRLISTTILLALIGVIILGIQKPKPVAIPQSKEARAAAAQSFETKLTELEQAQANGETGSEVRLSADEIRAAFSQLPDTSAASATPAANVSADDAAVLEQLTAAQPLVSFEGDQLKGQFAAEVGGKKLYVTVAGHLGSHDGYVTFDPTEFKVGDLNVPVSLVRDALNRKMAEQRDKMKLPDYIADLRVENGELVIRPK